MVNVFIYGLDQFVVGDLSKEITPILAKLYEVEEDEINFVAPNVMVFHKGVEQTSWRVNIEVHAQEEMENFQTQARDVLFHYVSQVAVHIEITFFYFCHHDHYVKINKDYPKYLESDEQDSEFEVEYSEEMEEGEGDDEIYTGDMFEGIEDKEECDDEECECHHHHNHH